ncbi:FxSxx-COOH system tetratricopeptide repeat protein [Micromonospora polyrhachis]|uniref:Cellulose biosynthesis protein BcsQ n=1 Tax=Micromonospora polyrhachis TaxID=1282883 RepID=A0A7W7SP60_9ACTN|nr:FxSxx-COOH system tetratricopeptide repeat protein [Micromonospora polyrhachis]MBB4958001.1 cellulose biosynthesis protein BcsQ [Micromonospora polyrhachis]
MGSGHNGGGIPDHGPTRVVSFVAATGNTGRTSIVTNLAWILASAGQRVLVLDSDLEGMRVHQYLQMYHVDEGRTVDLLPAKLARVLDTLMLRSPGVSPLDGAGARPLVRRYAALTGDAGRLDVVWLPVPSAAGPSSATGEVPPPDLPLSELRRQLRSTDYDYVLMDDPAGVSNAAVTRIAAVCDAVAICFTSQRARLDGATELARRVHREAPVGVQVMVVATQFDDSDSPEGERSRSDIRRAFLDALADSGDTTADDLVQVELPHRPYDQVLAPLMDESPSRHRLLTAYQRLTRAISNGAVDTVPLVSDAMRRRYQRSLGLQSGDGPEQIYLVYPPAQRPWADWIRAQLDGAGTRVRPLPVDWLWADVAQRATVMVLAPDDAPDASLELARLLPADPAAGQRPDIQRPDIIVIRTAAEPVPRSRSGYRTADIGNCSEALAHNRLRAALGMAGVPAIPAGPGWRPRFPAGPPSWQLRFEVPPRPLAFVGRAQELEAVRDHLLASAEAREVTLYGEQAVGKSDIAREYVHRFGYDYELIAWIPAVDRHSVRTALGRLAEELGVEPKGNPAQEVLKELRRRRAPWLLIYDGAGEAKLTDLLPVGGTGHVLVTRGPARPEATNGSRSDLTVTPLSRDDSIEVLLAQTPNLSADRAAEVTEVVGGMPLTLRATAGVLWQAGILLHARHGVARSQATDVAVPGFLAAVRPTPAPAGSTGQPAAVPSASARPEAPVGLNDVLRASFPMMREDFAGRVAIALAQMCVFVATEGITLRVVRSRELLAQLADAVDEATDAGAVEVVDGAADDTGGEPTGTSDGEVLRQDGWEVERALAAGVRFGLFSVDWGADSRLIMHSAMQSAVAATMTADERQRRQRQLLVGLALFAPGTGLTEAGDRRMGDLVELHRHLLRSGALEADDPPAVRQWVVTQFGYLSTSTRGEALAEGVRLGQSVLDRWVAVYGWRDRLTLRLATALADLRRLLGQEATAYELDTVALDASSALLGPDHLRTLVTRRGMAADQRGLGQFRAALIEDRATWRGFRDALGNDHPQTLRAAHNLALASYLAGFTEEALDRERDTLHRRIRLFGEEDPYTWWSASDVGTYERELGQLDAAYRTLTRAYARMLRIGGDDHPDTLRIVRALAVTERRRGEHSRAKDLNSRALLAYRRTVGEHHPRTRSCTLSLAADYHLAGETVTAVEMASRCLRGYRDEYDDAHPFTQICRVNLAVFLRGSGRVDEAVTSGQEGLVGLRTGLGEEAHPWALAAAINQAGNLVAAGDLTAAATLLRTTLEISRDLLGTEHRYVEVAERALGVLVSRRDGLETTGDRGLSVDYLDLEVPGT